MKPERLLLDPTSEQATPGRQRVPRPALRAGMTVGLLDISKPRGDVFLDRLAEILQGKGLEVQRYVKPTYARVAPGELYQNIVQSCDAVVEGLAD